MSATSGTWCRKHDTSGDTFTTKEQSFYQNYLGRTNALGLPMLFGAGEGAAQHPTGLTTNAQKFCYDSVRTALVPQGSNPSNFAQWKFLTQWDNVGGNDDRLASAQASGLTAYKTLVASSYMQPALQDTWVNPVTGWTEIYQHRHPLGTAQARTNYGAGMQGHALLQRNGSAPAVTLKSGGYGRWAGFVVWLSADRHRRRPVRHGRPHPDNQPLLGYDAAGGYR